MNEYIRLGGGGIPPSEKGQPNGVATLDGVGKIPVTQLPNAVFSYQGNWDALTNSPLVQAGTGVAGDTYLVTVEGTQDLGNGPVLFHVGDFIIYDGATWQESSGTTSNFNLYAPDGTSINPPYAFLNAINTGIFRDPGTGELHIEVVGNDNIVMTTNRIDFWLSGALIAQCQPTALTLGSVADLRLSDDKKVILGNSDGTWLKFSPPHYGLLFHTENGDPDNNGYLLTINSMNLSANTNSDGSGTWEPAIYMTSTGPIDIMNSSQGPVDMRYVRIAMANGLASGYHNVLKLEGTLNFLNFGYDANGSAFSGARIRYAGGGPLPLSIESQYQLNLESDRVRLLNNTVLQFGTSGPAIYRDQAYPDTVIIACSPTAYADNAGVLSISNSDGSTYIRGAKNTGNEVEAFGIFSRAGIGGLNTDMRFYLDGATQNCRINVSAGNLLRISSQGDALFDFNNSAGLQSYRKLRLIDGTNTAPSYTFTTSPTTGLFLTGGTVHYTKAGVDQGEIITTQALSGGYVNKTRPDLKWVNPTWVGVVDETVPVTFPDGVNRLPAAGGKYQFKHTHLLIYTNPSGSNQGGFRQYLTPTGNAWYYLYAIKCPNAPGEYVLGADDQSPVTAKASLDGWYGVNGWVYMGLIRDGDNLTRSTTILWFKQSGPHTIFESRSDDSSQWSLNGVKYARAASGNLTYTPTVGTGATDIPETMGIIDWHYAYAVSGASVDQMISYTMATDDSGFALNMYEKYMQDSDGAHIDKITLGSEQGLGIQIGSPNGSVATQFNICGWVDTLLK